MKDWPLCHVVHVTLPFGALRLYLFFIATSIFIGHLTYIMHILNINKDNCPALSLHFPVTPSALR